MEFPSPTYDVYTLGIFRPSFAVKTTLSRPHIFSMGENKDGRKKGQILKQWTYTGNRLQRETNMAPKIPKDSSYLMSILAYVCSPRRNLEYEAPGN